MTILDLAIRAGLPLLYIRTDDIINVEDVLTFIAKEPVRALAVPETIAKVSELKVPTGRVFYTSVECKSLAKLYSFAVEHEKTIIFVNTEKSVLQFDGGTLFPPKELVANFLKDIVAEDQVEFLLPCFGGLTLKDVGEIAKLTMTRDESLSPRGVNETRRGYMGKLRGIQQVDTDLPYYVCPSYLQEWLNTNKVFFIKPMHPSLVPRGLLFDGPPGTGKTLAAKKIASDFGVPLYRLDLGAMMGKYVGESEAALNASLTQVDQVAPCVVIFDEVEKIFQSQGDSGVTSRLLSQLLWWLQEHSSRVMTVMTTNNVKKIPDELHREGRIDQTMLFLGLEAFKEGYEFAQGAFDALSKLIGIETNPENYKTLQKTVKSLFSDNTAVPQSRITKEVNDLIREVIANKEPKE